MPEQQPPRRFPSPWRVVEIASAFRVDDANGQALGYFYFRDDDSVARQKRACSPRMRRGAWP
jgi:hypothetical protein